MLTYDNCKSIHVPIEYYKIHIRLDAITFSSSKKLVHPDECPICHNKITPTLLVIKETPSYLEALFQCPNSECRRFFIASIAPFTKLLIIVIANLKHIKHKILID